MAKSIEPEIPYCTIFLVCGALVCQTLVLVGNHQTAGMFDHLGDSTLGWSNVGVEIAGSMQSDLDLMMANVTEQLTETIEQLMQVQESMDLVLSTVGGAAEDAASSAVSATQSLLQQPGGHAAALALIQYRQPGPSFEDQVAGLGPLVIQAVSTAMERLMQTVVEYMDRFLDILRPVLEIIGQWMQQFGQRVQAGIETFTATMDSAQSMFDQIMAQMSGGGGEGEDVMLLNTYNLFDVSNSGAINITDLENVAEMYQIQALQGAISATLLDTYDADGSGDLNRAEFALFVHDDRIPGAMGTVLRAYARQLSQVGGQVGQARTRIEAARAIAAYLQLVCSKNMTKVGWVSEALTNGSLPMQLSADVMIQLGLNVDDPNIPAFVEVGDLVVGTMAAFNAEYVVQLMDLVANATFFAGEGFDVNDQPAVVERVAAWATSPPPPGIFGNDEAQQHKHSERGHSAVVASLAQLGAEATAEERTRVAKLMPKMARRLAEGGAKRHLQERRQASLEKRKRLLGTPAARHLYLRLLGGATVQNTGSNSDTLRVLGGMAPAAPETLVFAQWLAANASTNANIFQEMVTAYTGTSTGAVDSFADRLTGMSNRVQNFINMMMRYSTPAGIVRLEDRIREFATNSMTDVMNLVNERVDELVTTSMPAIQAGITQAVNQSGQAFADQVQDVYARALEGPVEGIVNGMANGQENNATREMARAFSDALSGHLANMTSDQLAGRVSSALEDVLGRALSEATNRLQQVSALQTASARTEVGVARSAFNTARARAAARAVTGQDPAGDGASPSAADAATSLGGAWSQMATTLQTLSNILPACIENLVFARTAVINLSSGLDSVFANFAANGPAIMASIARLYRVLWNAYFALMLPLNLMILYYGFWASGFFGGPQGSASSSDADYRPPETLGEKLSTCYTSCVACLGGCLKTPLCFWSCILLMEVFVLIVFLVALALSIIGAVKVLLVSGCAQIYVLGDDTVCAGSIETVNGFLSDFNINGIPNESVCTETNLLMCQAISQSLGSSTILTCVGGFLGVVFAFQMLFDSAMLFERARWRGIVADMENEK